MDISSAIVAKNSKRIAEIFVELCGTKEAACELLENVLDATSTGLPRKRLSASSAHEESPKNSRIELKADPVTYLNDEVDSSPITLAVQIPNDSTLVSYIVGKSGVHVQELQTVSGAKVQIEKRQGNGGEGRVIFLLGNIKTTLAAFQLLLKRIEERPYGGSSDVSRIVAPKELISHIIGKGGSSIKRIESASGCHIDIQTEVDMMQAATMSPGTVFGRTLSLSGAVTSRVNAVYHILRSIASDRNLPEQWRGQPPPALSSASVPMSYTAVPRMQGMGPPDMGMGGGMGMGMGPGMGMNMGGANMQQGGMGMGMGGSPMNMGGGGMNMSMGPPVGSPGRNGASGPLTNVEIKVPSGSVSFIIGQKGASISEIQRMSGCNVMVDKNQTDGQERKITITGPLAGTSKAVDVIGQRVMEWRAASPPPQPQQSQQGQYGGQMYGQMMAPPPTQGRFF